MNEEVKELLMSIATQLGVKIDQVTQAYIKFRMVDSFRFFLIWFILFCVSVFLFKKALCFFKSGKDEAKEKYEIDEWDYDGTRWFILFVAGIVTLVAFIAALCNTEWLVWLAAPEGSFYDTIINKLV